MDIAENLPLSKYVTSNLTTSKICRLCGTKDGPFLNIFGPGMGLARKIEELLLILVTEWDDLPHKICFRCSAKIADFEEFHDKCIKTQENLSALVGKDFNYKRDKSKNIRSNWEAKLNKNKISNDEYCDELVKKALESAVKLGNIGSPSSPASLSITKDAPEITTGTRTRSNRMHIKDAKIPLKKVDFTDFPGIEVKGGKFHVVNDKVKSSTTTASSPDLKPQTRADKRNAHVRFQTLSETQKANQKDTKEQNQNDKIQDNSKKNKMSSQKTIPESEHYTRTSKRDLNKKQTEKTIESEVSQSNRSDSVLDKSELLKKTELRKTDSKKNSDIPENFTTVKVAGVGPVYTCKKCDHLLLHKEKVFQHKCLVYRNTKNSVETEQSTETSNNVSESNNKSSSNDSNNDSNSQDIEKNQKPSPAQRKRKSEWIAQSNTDNSDNILTLKRNAISDTLTKSKVSKTQASQDSPASLPVSNETPQFQEPKILFQEDSPLSIATALNVPLQLSNNYYLTPSGNNSFTLRLGPPPLLNIPTSTKTSPKINLPLKISQYVPSDSILPDSNRFPTASKPLMAPAQGSSTSNQKSDKLTIKIVSNSNTPSNKNSGKNSKNSSISDTNKKSQNSVQEIITPTVPSAPYPVGLLCRNSGGESMSLDQQHSMILGNALDKSMSERLEYPKYTILPPKTPGKIVIAAVPPQKNVQKASEDEREPPKKRGRKIAVAVKPQINEKPAGLTAPCEPEVKQHNQHFFTYVNLDPMFNKSSYVLPGNSFQENRVTGTVIPVSYHKPPTPKVEIKKPAKMQLKTSQQEEFSKYTCEICDLQFSREKKLNAHVKTHYAGYYDDA